MDEQGHKPPSHVRQAEAAVVDAPSFWEGLYHEQSTPWDLGHPAPALVAWLEGEGAAKPGSRVLVPGCGRGHDARALAQAGWEVMAFDFAPAAVADARALGGPPNLAFHQADLFALPAGWDGAFDMVFEHTCFCAIQPSRRPDYVRAVHRALKPGGLLAAIFFCHGEPGGPPFDTRPESIAPLFEAEGPFRLERLEAAVSIPRREGEEMWGLLRRLP